MSAQAFGEWAKGLRQSLGLTLRAFCQQHGFDPGNYSRLERGLLPPPHDEEKLAGYARALSLRPGTPAWQEFFDRAAVARGEVPKDLLSDGEVAGKLPLLFRTSGVPPCPRIGWTTWPNSYAGVE
jgi:transcriptional regulator with XRE-family HTH domain